MAEYIDLYTLQSTTRVGVESLYPDTIWVRAEISAMSVKANGHCYLELSQNEGKTLIAKVRAMIWKGRYQLLSQYFTSITGASLKPGMEILANVRVTYHEIYGLSLTIEDIDPDFTQGQRERQRQETIDKLKVQGLLDKQRNLSIPVLPYRLAVISSASAAGFGDFKRHLLENEYQFAYELILFEATMQGQDAASSIQKAMKKICSVGKTFDAVLILRGGGSELDLDCFDDYGLAVAIANYPIPIFTAIGHDRDYHVADMVAYANVKTPTALADYFIERTLKEDERILSYQMALKLAFMNKLNALESRLQFIEMKLETLDPRNVLKRGYSLILNDKGIKLFQARSVKAGEKITVMMPDGSLDCTVNELRLNEKE